VTRATYPDLVALPENLVGEIDLLSIWGETRQP
jgi:hypothetical protein